MFYIFFSLLKIKNINYIIEMGTKCCATSSSKIIIDENGDNLINKLNFIKKYPIGKGGFGRVNKNNNNNIFY